jgi:hypothetical protein
VFSVEIKQVYFYIIYFFEAELQLILQEVENETELNNGEIAYDSANSIELEL